MVNNLKELSHIEGGLPKLVFTQEQSSLSEINSHFSPFQGSDFLSWLNWLSSQKERVEVLELGGGIKLVAASELLESFRNLYLTEIEKRNVEWPVREKLQRDNRLFLYQTGFSETFNKLTEKRFDVIFIHNVLLHLLNPFFILEKCFGLLVEGGLLFVNGILIYREVWVKIVRYLQEKNYQFSFNEEELRADLRKKGLISVSLTIKKSKQDENLVLPIKSGDFLTDFFGNLLPTREIFFSDE